MNVVVRGVMSAGMGIYGAIHATQALTPPDGAPPWLAFAFAASALAAFVIAGMLILSSTAGEGRWEVAGAGLALSSAIALGAAYTVGFLGVRESDLRAETAVVLVAEVMTLAAFVVARIGAAAEEDLDKNHDERVA